jgi:hypothetical protein
VQRRCSRQIIYAVKGEGCAPHASGGCLATGPHYLPPLRYPPNIRSMSSVSDRASAALSSSATTSAPPASARSRIARTSALACNSLKPRHLPVDVETLAIDCAKRVRKRGFCWCTPIQVGPHSFQSPVGVRLSRIVTSIAQHLCGCGNSALAYHGLMHFIHTTRNQTRSNVKWLDAQMLLDPLEEQLHLLAALVNGADRQGR